MKILKSATTHPHCQSPAASSCRRLSESSRQKNFRTSRTSLKGKGDRAILSTFLFDGLRRDELCALKVKDIHPRRGVPHLRIHGKSGKLRYLPVHAAALERINDYLEAAGHGEDQNGALSRPVKNPITGDLEKSLSPGAIYNRIVKKYAVIALMRQPSETS